MQIHEEQFLFLLKSYFNNEKVPEGFITDPDRVFFLASVHNMLPVVYSKLIETSLDVSKYKKSVVSLCGNQIRKNLVFESLFSELINNNINIIVVKGPVCANCYPEYEMRLSSDFDIITDEESFDKLDSYLKENGYKESNGSYFSDNTGLYLEVSTQLGEGSESLRKTANVVFGDFFSRTIRSENYHTLSETDHIAYLIFHAFKHFIGSGFGVKQLTDIYLFEKKYHDRIDFDKMNESLKKMGITDFAYNIWYAIEKIFGCDFSFLLENADYSKICYDDFISDLLSAGVFGKSSEDRLHSASVVQSAVENGGKKTVFKTIFPSVAVMKKKYKTVEKFPFLVPLFWLIRVINYLFKAVLSDSEVSPLKSLDIAEDRIELMKKMGII